MVLVVRSDIGRKVEVDITLVKEKAFVIMTHSVGINTVFTSSMEGDAGKQTPCHFVASA